MTRNIHLLQCATLAIKIAEEWYIRVLQYKIHGKLDPLSSEVRIYVNLSCSPGFR